MSPKSGNEQQQETYRGLINSTHDGLLLFEAIGKGLLYPLKSKLTTYSRARIDHGSVFIFEIGPSTGIQRFNDSRLWSPSRVFGDFFIYHECEVKVSPKQLGYVSKRAELTDHHQKAESSLVTIKGKAVPSGSKGAFLLKKDGLFKKTLSATINGVPYQLVSYSKPVLNDDQSMKENLLIPHEDLLTPSKDSRFFGLVASDAVQLTRRPHRGIKTSRKWSVFPETKECIDNQHINAGLSSEQPSLDMFEPSFISTHSYSMDAEEPMTDSISLFSTDRHIDPFFFWPMESCDTASENIDPFYLGPELEAMIEGYEMPLEEIEWITAPYHHFAN